MATASDPSLRALHALRLTSAAPVEVVAAVADLEPGEVLALLETFRGKDWVVHREGAISGWMLTTAGRTEDERMVADELEATGAREQVVGAYRRFLALNQACLQVCTDWQLVAVDGTQAVNDHTDLEHDRAVIARLRELETDAQPIVADLASVLGRFSNYGPRLAVAVDRVEAGDGDWFTRPGIDSFHTVWFQLHEDLLATLGIERGSEVLA